MDIPVDVFIDVVEFDRWWFIVVVVFTKKGSPTLFVDVVVDGIVDDESADVVVSFDDKDVEGYDGTVVAVVVFDLSNVAKSDWTGGFVFPYGLPTIPFIIDWVVDGGGGYSIMFDPGGRAFGCCWWFDIGG